MLTSRAVASAELSLDVTKHSPSKLCVKRKYFALSEEEYFITDNPSHVIHGRLSRLYKKVN